MKYALIDGEIMIHQREQDAYWPLSIEEAQHVVDVMNVLTRDDLSRVAASLGVPTDMIARAEALLDSDDKPE